MLIVCILSVLFGILYAQNASGWNGMLVVGAIWIGEVGGIYSVILLLYTIIKYIVDKTKGEM